MFVVRNVFKCKPGQAKSLVDRLQKAMSLMPAFQQRILVDYIGNFWTVVLEIEVQDLNAYEEQYKQYVDQADVQEAMSGYMESVESGYREVFRLV